ncbi:hypothetical protein [Croceibacterium ferulae]|uniref:hypothetical protein n=1 Tax=Croceibacterium ferulae TaxID=1854641 RepID=UPI000F86A541|nr:hypothetical protein [Croceibacterium ferulae]
MQNDLPPLPEMKPMPSAAPAEPLERPAPRGQYAAQPAAPFGRRVRQLFTAFTGMGFGLMLGAGILQVTMPPQWKPTTIVAMIEAQIELAIMNQKMGAEPGEIIINEAEYREKLAKAERDGQTSAELELQKQMAVVQADKERVVQAYATLYQRANLIAQAAIQLETLAQQFRQQLLQMSNGGRSMVIVMKDLFCGFSGDPATCESARADRRLMIDEADELSRGDVGNRVRELMAGVDDPATLVARNDQQANGTPALDRGEQRDPTFGITTQP